MSQTLVSAIAGELSAYDHARQHGHVSEQATAALNLLRTTTRHLAESDYPHNREAAREIRETLAKVDGEASE